MKKKLFVTDKIKKYLNQKSLTIIKKKLKKKKAILGQYREPCYQV